MANVVMKYSVMETGSGKTPNESTNQNKAGVGNSPISLVLSNYQTVTWGPNETHTLAQPYADEALAANNRLKEVSRS